MTYTTYRAAGWIADNNQSDVRLTREEHKDLPDEELLAIAKTEAESVGLNLEGGEIQIGEWTE